MNAVEADVCIVGAGSAGLAAARCVQRAGRTVAVLEARDRVGGRVWTRHFEDGTPSDMGRTWLGDGHERMHALAREYGLATYPTHQTGSHVFVKNGVARRYDGLIPPVDPLSMAGAFLAMKRLDWMAGKVDLEAPWTTPHARDLDASSIADWVSSPFSLLTPTARDMLGVILGEIYTSDLSETSLLHLLFQIRGSRTLEYIGTAKGGAQQELVTGGAQSIANAIAKELGDGLHLATPVRKIAQRNGGVEISSERLSVRARHAIVAIPLAIQSTLQYDPPLAPDRVQLMQRSPSGAIVRAVIEWDEPFWRADGLTGITVDIDGPISSSIDASPADASRGVISAYAYGPRGRWLAAALPGGATPHLPGSARQALWCAGAHTARVPRDQLGVRAVVRRRHAVALPARRIDQFGSYAAQAGRAHSLGRRRDSHRLARLHGGRCPQRRTSGGRGA